MDDVELAKVFKRDFSGFYVALDQVFVINFNKSPYILTVDKIVGGGDSFTTISK